MGRKTDVLLRGFRAAKCLTLLKLATARIKVMRNKRSTSAKQMRTEIAQLLRTGQDAQVYISKADALIKQENMVAVYDLIDQYCHTVISRFPMIEIQRTCPPDVKEAIATLIYAAPRCVEISDLAGIREAFLAKYGKEFVTAAAELRSDCGVNPQVIEFLTTRPASGQVKLKLMKEICAEHNVHWIPGEALGESIRNQPMVPPNQHVDAKVESTKVDGRPSSLPAAVLPSRIGEAGPSSSSLDGRAHLKVDGSVGAVHKVGLAAVESSGKISSNASAVSELGMVGRGKGSSPESLNVAINAGALSTGSSKAGDGATFSAVPSELSQTKPPIGAEDEVVTGEGSSGSESFVGVMDASIASVDIESPEKGEVEAAHSQPADDTHHGALSDTDESFVSIGEERLEDEVNSFLEAAASRTESFPKGSVEASVEADLLGPRLSKERFKETGEESITTENLHEEVYFGVSTYTSFRTESKNKVDELMQSKGNGSPVGSSLGSRTESLRREHDPPDKNETKSVSEGVVKLSGDEWEEKEREKIEKPAEHDPPYESQEENMPSPKVAMEEINQNGNVGTLMGDNLEASEDQIALSEESALEMFRVDSFHESLKGDFKSNLEKASQSVGGGVTSEDLRNEIRGAPTMESIDLKMVHATPSSVLASPDDFAATAAAIAAEAARLAVLDYAKRMSGSSSVSFDLSDLTKLGLTFGDNMQGKHVGDILNNRAKNADLGAQKLANSMTSSQDVAENDKSVKVDTLVQDTDAGKGLHPSVDEMGYIWDWTEGNSNLGSKQKATEDDNLAVSSKTSVESKNLPEVGMEIDDINPFAGIGETVLTNSFSKKLFSFQEDGETNWVGMLGHGLTKAARTFGQDDDHLDIFFRRKASWIPVEEPRIHEDLYSFTKVKTSFAEETLLFSSHHEQKGHDVPPMSLSKPLFDAQPQKQDVSIFVEENMASSAHDEGLVDVQEKLLSMPMFDDLPLEESRVTGEGAESLRRPVFDEVSDDETDTYSKSSSLNDCVDKGASPVLRVGDQSPPRMVGPTTADVEGQPCFDKFLDEPEEPSPKKTGGATLGWNKPSITHEPTEETHTVTKERLGSSTSDALPGGSSNPMSRRSRRKSPRVHENENGSELAYASEDGGRSSHSTSKMPSTGVMQLQETGMVSKNLDSHGVQGYNEVQKGADQPEKTMNKTYPPSRRLPSLRPQSTSPPIESSISDPIILATMPPPVKKPVTPPSPSMPMKLETSSSAPPSTATSMASNSIGVQDEKASKLPQKPPTVDDLSARYEALRRARRGE